MTMIKYMSKDTSTVCPVEGPSKVSEILAFQEASNGKVRILNPRTGKETTCVLTGTAHQLWAKGLHHVLEGSKADPKPIEIGLAE